MNYAIWREQLVPPGEDCIVDIVTGDNFSQNVLEKVAQAETETRTDVDHISTAENRVVLVGQPANTGNKYSPYSSMVNFTARPFVPV